MRGGALLNPRILDNGKYKTHRHKLLNQRMSVKSRPYWREHQPFASRQNNQ